MRDKKYAGIIAGIFVTAVTAFTIWGTDFLGSLNADKEVAITVSGAEGIKEAAKLTDKEGTVTGYKVVTTSKGFAGDVELTFKFEADAKTLKDMELGANNETPTLGGKVGAPEFINTIKGVAAPVKVKGSTGTGAEIDGVTGATITSTAVATGINNAFNFIQSNK